MTSPSAIPFLGNLSLPIPPAMDALSAPAPRWALQLAHQDALALSVGVGTVVYLIFKRFEPVLVYQHFWLLVVPPALVAACVLSPHYAPARAALIAFGVHYATIAGTTLFYRAGPWHPLAQYPGPYVYRLSKIALAWRTSDGKQFVHLRRLHDRYGDIVRIAQNASESRFMGGGSDHMVMVVVAVCPNEVSIRDSSAIIPVLGTNGLPKGPHWAGRNMTDSAQQLVSLVDIREHARRRRPWNRAFSVPALKEYEEYIARRAEQLVELFATHAREGKPANAGKCVGSFTYDLMSDMAFGGGSEQMRDGDKDSVWALMEQGLAASQVMGHCPWLGIYLGYVPFAARLMKQLLDYGEERVLARVKNGSLKRDIFYYLNNEDGAEKEAPPLSTVAIDGALAIVAGSDTSSCVLAHALYCVLTHPDVYKRLQTEVDAFFPPGENALDTARHADMPWLNAVINETMRVYPPLPSGSQRATTRETGGRMVGSYYIPPETTVNIPFYVLHHDPRNFSPKTDSFWPDRWLIASSEQKFEGAPGEEFVHNTAAFLPFSYGPANCVGKGLAMQELRMVLCLLVQKLHLRLADGWDPKVYDEQILEWLVMIKPYLPVVVERRPGPVH
ncbi:high nitrogen upregulated cytochrome P450 monooxygenase 2 [Dichomitus squalens]|nr:high nitrogen upregulated cytochrome P450 monooxygenase 2 [Dichomitus squalens]